MSSRISNTHPAVILYNGILESCFLVGCVLFITGGIKNDALIKTTTGIRDSDRVSAAPGNLLTR